MFSGVCWLVFITLSVGGGSSWQVKQKPRFYGVRSGSSVAFYCFPAQTREPTVAEWFKAQKHDAAPEERTLVKGDEKRVLFHNKETLQKAFLLIRDVTTEDSAVYFCKINDTFGPGTQLQAARPVDLRKALYRTQLKDGLIVLQGLLLAACIAAIIRRNRTLLEKRERESEYEEPETDHIYEGLAVDSLGGGLYEELSVYAQADGAEAPWE